MAFDHCPIIPGQGFAPCIPYGECHVHGFKPLVKIE